jgi:hypothetical protein
MIGKCLESGGVGRIDIESGLLLQSAHVSVLLLGNGLTADSGRSHCHEARFGTCNPTPYSCSWSSTSATDDIEQWSR